MKQEQKALNRGVKEVFQRTHRGEEEGCFWWCLWGFHGLVALLSVATTYSQHGPRPTQQQEKHEADPDLLHVSQTVPLGLWQPG